MKRKRKKKKLELFREQQRAQRECVVGKATENIQKFSQAIGFKANVNLRESLCKYRFTLSQLDLTAGGVLLTLG